MLSGVPVFIVEVKYKSPPSVANFERDYFGTHVPLVERIPKLVAFTVARGPLVGQEQVFLLARLIFASEADADVALATPEAAAAVANVEAFASGLYTLSRYCERPASEVAAEVSAN